MAEQFYTILTAIGKAKIANSAALGEKVELTHLALGDGGGSYYNPTEDQTELRNEVWRGAIDTVDVDGENPNWITIQTVVPSQHGGFMIREAGVFDDEGDLIAVGKYPETYKPLAADGSIKDLVVRMILEVGNTSSVQLKVDPTIVLATKKDINDLAGAGRTTQTVKGNADSIAALQQAFASHLADNVPHATKNNIDYYINPVFGSDDTGDGSQGNPFQTIQHAIDKLPQTINHIVTINLAAGLYNESIDISGFAGRGALFIYGDTVLSDNYTVQNVVVHKCTIPVMVRGLKSQTTTAHSFFAAISPSVEFSFCKCDAESSTADGFQVSAAKAKIVNCYVANKLAAIRALNMSVVYSSTNTGSGNSYGLLCESASKIGKNSTQPGGITAEFTSGGGEIL